MRIYQSFWLKLGFFLLLTRFDSFDRFHQLRWAPLAYCTISKPIWIKMCGGSNGKISRCGILAVFDKNRVFSITFEPFVRFQFFLHGTIGFQAFRSFLHGRNLISNIFWLILGYSGFYTKIGHFERKVSESSIIPSPSAHVKFPSFLINHIGLFLSSCHCSESLC